MIGACRRKRRRVRECDAISVDVEAFPSLEAELGALDEKHRAFVDLCAALHEHFPAARYEWGGNGKPPTGRVSRMFRRAWTNGFRRRRTKSSAPRGRRPKSPRD